MTAYEMRISDWSSDVCSSDLEGDDSWKQKLSYLSLPVLARYQLVEGLRLEVGPQVGLLLSAKSVVDMGGEEVEDDIKDNTESIDFGLTGGASYQLPVGVGIFARYYAGLTDLGKEDTGDVTIKKNNIRSEENTSE